MAGYLVRIALPDRPGALGLVASRIGAVGGDIVAIDDPEDLDLMPLKSKSITWHWELMFTRSLFHTADIAVQHDALERVAQLVDAGVLRTTMTNELAPFNAATMRRAHQLIERGHTIGKVVVSGF